MQGTSNLDFEAIVGTLPRGWRSQAVDLGFVGRHPNAALTDPDVLMHGLMLHVGVDLPLRQTAAVLAESGAVKVSHVALHRRMRAAGPLVQELVSRMGAERGESNAEDWGGYVPVLIDGSVVVTPKHNEFDGRLHTAMRLCDLTVVDAYVTTNEEGETLKRFSFGPGQLAVADRGFANPVGIANVLAQGADVLVRVNRGALPLYALNGDPIDLLGWVRTLKSGRVSSRQVVTESGAARESCGRLLAKRIPREKREAARARARKEFGDDPIALELSEWVLLFTTASSAKLPDAQVMRLYACRWQIELLFKRMKSLCHLDKLPNFRPDTVVSWLGIKLLLFMCLEKLAQPVTDGLSPPADSTASARRPSHACTPTLEADDVAMASRRRRAHAHVAA